MKITINGLAGAGKGTIAKKFAQESKIQYVDIGLIFRLGAYATSKKGLCLSDLSDLIKRNEISYIWTGEKALVYWGNKDITSFLLVQEITKETSVLSAITDSHNTLTAIANNILQLMGDVICDGRNAGTTILPFADYKFYATASVEVRAKRRLLQIIEQGLSDTYENVLKEIIERDRRDQERAIHPIVIPEHAIILHTDILSIQEAVAIIWNAIRK